MHRLGVVALGLVLAGTPGLLLAAPIPPATAHAPLSWPRDITSDGQTLVIYQPQIESWDGVAMRARAAVAVGPATGGNPSYGVLVFTCRTEVDKPDGVVRLSDMKIEQVSIPTAPDRAAAAQSLIQSRLPPDGFTASLDQMLAAYALDHDTSTLASVAVKNDPPHVMFSAVPATLVLIDGDPALRPLPGTAYQRVINAKPLVLKDAQGAFYAWAAGYWYRAADLNGPWSVLGAPPATLAAAKDAAAKQQDFDPMPAASGEKSAPALYVSTTPAELVITTGQPNFVPVSGLSLLELRNADHAVFLDPATNKTYLLISGRWFTAPGLAGPWGFVAANAPPADLAKIPTDDPKADVLISVPGTPQAREAAIAATMPQTAKVDRKTAKLAVQYAGAPQFAPIPGTSLQYATNTATQLVRADPQHYYAVSNGVWFVAASPAGPWQVADSVPEAIYAIPPASPLYPVTYVRVYQATPDYVVVGYTPGYLGVYVAPYGTVVYGTGYFYPPYIGPVWYGYPATYGYGAGFAVGATAGFAFGFAAGWAASPYWGPYSWHGGYVNWQHVNVSSASVYTSWHGSASVTHVSGWNGAASWGATSVHAFNPYTGRGINSQSGHYTNAATGTEAAGRRTETYNTHTGAEHASRTGGAYNPNTGNYAAGHAGAGHNPSTGRTGAHQTTVTGNTANGTRSVNSRGVEVNPRTNSAVAWHNGDVYAGHDGNVYKHDENGWSQHTSDGWQSVDRSNGAVNGLNRDYQGRQYGDQRFGQDYNGFNRGGGGGGRFRR